MPLRILIFIAHALLLALVVAVAPSTGTASQGHGRVYVAAKANCTQDCPEAHWLCATWARFVMPTCAAKPDLNKLFESVPQRSAVQAVRARLERTAADPTTPAVFVFAGDHGVGKTRMAHLLSLATSACSGRDRGGQPRGESLFEIDSIHSELDPAGMRALLVPKLIAHVRRHPNAVVLVDNFPLLFRALDRLAPLLGGTHYPEDPSVSFQGATVILTMDFGGDGETQHMSEEDIVSASIRHVGGSLAYAAKKFNLKHAEIVPFVPLNYYQVNPPPDAAPLPPPPHRGAPLHVACRAAAVGPPERAVDACAGAWQRPHRGADCGRGAQQVHPAAQEAAYRRTGAHVEVEDLPAFKCRLLKRQWRR
jgi:hypothetical protein